MEILRVLWDAGPSGLGVVRAALQERREVAGTTVATMLEVMRKKGLVQRDDSPSGYVYTPLASREATQTGLLHRLLDAAFDGSAQRLVAHLFQSGRLTDADRDAIQRLLDAERDRVSGPPTESKRRPRP
jgi:predicted transcriptional regulator